jgi:hypothetical protein
MNALMQRWVQACRRELLDRTLIGNQHHLLRALREFEVFYNHHRPTEASRRPGRCVQCRRRSLIRSHAGVGSRILRACELAGQMDSKEFVVLLSDTTACEALQVAARVHGSLAADPISAGPDSGLLPRFKGSSQQCR